MTTSHAHALELALDALRSSGRGAERYDPETTHHVLPAWEAFVDVFDALERDGGRAAYDACRGEIDAVLASLHDWDRRAPGRWLDRVRAGDRPLGWELVRALDTDRGGAPPSDAVTQVTCLYVGSDHLSDAIGEWTFPNVTHLTASRPITAGEVARLLDNMPSLVSLVGRIADGELGGIAKLPGMKRLRELGLDGGRAEVVELFRSEACRSLESVRMRYEVSDGGLSALVDRDGAVLKHLHVTQTSKKGHGVILKALRGPLSRLETLALDSPRFGKGTVLPETLKELRLVVDDGIRLLVACPTAARLRKLALTGYGIDLDSAAQLARWPVVADLEHLHLQVHEDATDAPYARFFERLAEMPRDRLRVLSLQLYEVGDDACESLAAFIAGCPALRSLDITCLNPAVTGLGAAKLVPAVTGLHHLGVQIPALLGALGEAGCLPELRSLSVQHASPRSEQETKQMGPGPLRPLTAARFPALRVLRLEEAALAADAAEALAASDLPLLRLELEGLAKQHASAMEALVARTGLPHLRSLRVSTPGYEGTDPFGPLRDAGVRVSFHTF